jgi:NADPH:quinone reductase-like Zn-dependent oxidoreductase
MKAAVRTSYGPPGVVRIADVEAPVPGDGDVLIRVRAASVNPLDLFAMRGAPLVRHVPGLRRPASQILGCDIAGRVEAVGRHATRFRPGDEVFGVTGFSGGGLAEHACAPEGKLALKPASVSFEEAAAVPVAAITALQGLRDKGGLRPGLRVLIEGASGGVGTFAIQIARAFGADVTAVCSARNVELARSIGADQVIDYAQEDFTTGDRRYDLILGANAHRSIVACRRALTRDGTLVVIGGGARYILEAASLGSVLSIVGRRKTRFFIAKVNAADLECLRDLLESRRVAPVVDRRYPLSDAADALRYLEEGHARGKVVITMDDERPA